MPTSGNVSASEKFNTIRFGYAFKYQWGHMIHVRVSELHVHYISDHRDLLILFESPLLVKVPVHDSLA